MSWLNKHRESEKLASEAETLARRGKAEQSRALYSKAARAEHEALESLSADQSRTIGISAISAVSLYYKAQDFTEAEKTAITWLERDSLPSFAYQHLRNLLQSIWSELARSKSERKFAPGQVLISVSGGEVIEGGAPLDLILSKVQVVQSMFYRTAELLRDLPYRKHGPPSRQIQESCRPWLFQTAPGSYQFAVAIQGPTQHELFTTRDPTPKDISARFLEILRAGVDSPTIELPKVVSNQDYRDTFLKLTRNLAPRGKIFEELKVRSADESASVTLEPATRKAIFQAIRGAQTRSLEVEESLTGILRAVHLDKDWLEVTIGDEKHIRVTGVGETVDDLIGPMVNKPVVVEVRVDQSGRHHFIDIEPDD